MIFAENILICLIAPMLVSVFLLKGNTKRYTIFFCIGMTCCLIAAYCNSFLAGAFSLAPQDAFMKLTPLSEELLKMLPILFYALLLTPKKEYLSTVAIAIGIGFATFENCYYIVQNGTENMIFLLLRGFAAGTMHTVTATIIGYGLSLGIYQKFYYTIAIVFGLWCVTGSYHAVYNMLVYMEGFAQMVGYILPITTIIVILLLQKVYKKSFVKNRT